MTNYNDGKWHGWNGGECPVHPETVVDLTIWTTNDRGVSGIDAHVNIKAGSILWYSVNSFRVIKEYKEPREFWIWPNGNDVLNNKPHVGGEHYIHVREVLE